MDSDKRDQEWAQWMRAGIAGDAAAYRRFLTAAAPFLRGIAQRRCAQLGASPSDAEDVVQDVLLAIHLKRGTWDPQRPIGPWLSAIVRNKVIDVFRRRRQQISIPIDDVIDTLQAEQTADSTDTRTVERMLSHLKERQRTIVTSISLEGASIRQTAEKLDLSEGAVRVALHRALKSLAALYRNENS